MESGAKDRRVTPFVEITWIDIFTQAGWIDDLDQWAADAFPTFKTRGWMTHDFPDYVVLVSTISDDGKDTGDATKFPRGVIIECKVLTGRKFRKLKK